MVGSYFPCVVHCVHNLVWSLYSVFFILWLLSVVVDCQPLLLFIAWITHLHTWWWQRLWNLNNNKINTHPRTQTKPTHFQSLFIIKIISTYLCQHISIRRFVFLYRAGTSGRWLLNDSFHINMNTQCKNYSVLQK